MLFYNTDEYIFYANSIYAFLHSHIIYLIKVYYYTGIILLKSHDGNGLVAMDNQIAS